MGKPAAPDAVDLFAAGYADKRSIVPRVTAERDLAAVNHQVLIPPKRRLHSGRLPVAHAVLGVFEGRLGDAIHEPLEGAIHGLAAHPADPRALACVRHPLDRRVFLAGGRGHAGTRGDGDVAFPLPPDNPAGLLPHLIEFGDRKVDVRERAGIGRRHPVEHHDQVLVLGRAGHVAVPDPVAGPALFVVRPRMAGPHGSGSAQAGEPDLLLEGWLALAVVLRRAHLVIGRAVGLDIGAEHGGGAVVGHLAEVARGAADLLLLRLPGFGGELVDVPPAGGGQNSREDARVGVGLHGPVGKDIGGVFRLEAQSQRLLRRKPAHLVYQGLRGAGAGNGHDGFGNAVDLRGGQRHRGARERLDRRIDAEGQRDYRTGCGRPGILQIGQITAAGTGANAAVEAVQREVEHRQIGDAPGRLDDGRVARQVNQVQQRDQVFGIIVRREPFREPVPGPETQPHQQVLAAVLQVPRAGLAQPGELAFRIQLPRQIFDGAIQRLMILGPVDGVGFDRGIFRVEPRPEVEHHLLHAVLQIGRNARVRSVHVQDPEEAGHGEIDQVPARGDELQHGVEDGRINGPAQGQLSFLGVQSLRGR